MRRRNNRCKRSTLKKQPQGVVVCAGAQPFVRAARSMKWNSREQRETSCVHHSEGQDEQREVEHAHICNSWKHIFSSELEEKIRMLVNFFMESIGSMIKKWIFHWQIFWIQINWTNSFQIKYLSITLEHGNFNEINRRLHGM